MPRTVADAANDSAFERETRRRAAEATFAAKQKLVSPQHRTTQSVQDANRVGAPTGPGDSARNASVRDQAAARVAATPRVPPTARPTDMGGGNVRVPPVQAPIAVENGGMQPATSAPATGVDPAARERADKADRERLAKYYGSVDPSQYDQIINGAYSGGESFQIPGTNQFVLYQNSNQHGAPGDYRDFDVVDVAPEQLASLRAAHPGMTDAQLATEFRQDRDKKMMAAEIARQGQAIGNPMAAVGQVTPSGNTPFGPGNDLRATQINPEAAKLSALQEQAKKLIEGSTPDFTKALADIDSAQGTSPEATRVRQLAMQLLEGLGNQPNRTDIAQQKLDIFNDRSADTLRDQLQTTGRANAALGRLGSGMVRDDLRSAVTDIDKERSLLARELAADTAGLEFSDQLARLNAGLATGNQFHGQDMDLANLALSRAGARTGIQNAGFGASMQQAGALAGLDNQAFGQGVTNRNELRTERGFQQGMAQQALDNARTEALLQEQLTGGDFNRRMDYIRTLMQGGSYDPSGTYLGVSGQASADAGAGLDAASQIAYLEAIRRGRGGGAGAASGAQTTGDVISGGFA